MIKCTKCKKTKEVTEFYKRSDGYGNESRCKQCAKDNKRRHYELTKSEPHFRWKNTQSAAKQRGLKVNLSKNEYFDLIVKPCNYCGKNTANEVGCGLDRLDNNKDYMIGNVVPCCGDCNSGRGDRYTPTEWQIMVNALLKFRKKINMVSIV